MRSIDAKTFQVTLTYTILLIVSSGRSGIGYRIGYRCIRHGGQEWFLFDEPLTQIGGVDSTLFRCRLPDGHFLLPYGRRPFWRKGRIWQGIQLSGDSIPSNGVIPQLFRKKKSGGRQNE